MKIKLMHSFGHNDIGTYEWNKPDITDEQIEIKPLMVGICRSDIAAYSGWEKPMPLGMFGHEGTGIVTKIGKNINDINVGDYVATWSDPAYGELYNADKNQYAKLPNISPQYIMQPTACAINIYKKTLKYMEFNGYQDEEILLIGTGFMSMVIGQLNNKIHVLGKSNKNIWESFNIPQYPTIESLPKDKYKVIIDLSSNAKYYYEISNRLADVEALICYAATPFEEVKTNFFENCWNCHTLIMPSPRNSDFNDSMKEGIEMIQNGKLKTDFLWTGGYKAFDIDEMKKAFEDGKNRTESYIRGYFVYE
ncbi:MAG: alcohol dehydrogenase catalytic domain-containing protein [Candidatus Kapaibacteriota bacterium]